MAAKKWTSKEDEMLLKLYKNVSVSQLAKRLNHTVPATKTRLIQLKIEELSQVSGIKAVTILKALNLGAQKTRIRGSRYYYKNIAMRSVWETHCAQIFDHLGYEWKYEPRVFHFEATTGSKIYTPDFYVTDPQGNSFWIEVKGRVYSGTYTKLKNFRNSYPEEFEMLRGIPRKGTPADRLFTKLDIPIYGYYSDLVNKYSSIFH